MSAGGEVLGEVTRQTLFIKTDEDPAVRLSPDQDVGVFGTFRQFTRVTDPHGVDGIAAVEILLEDGRPERAGNILVQDEADVRIAW
jgi:hypothetical protein